MYKRNDALSAVLLCLLAGLLPTCGLPARTLHVPEEGYRWPSTDRACWPTDGWRTAHDYMHLFELAVESVN